MHLLAVYLAICTSVLASGDVLDVNEELLASEEDYIEWEYEPRIWSLDDQPDESPSRENFSFEGPNDSFNGQSDDWEHLQQSSMDNPHIRHHYMITNNVASKQTNQEECTQFRVDTREAIICDKKRCDKLDFEWPEYDNQLTMIETTRHGMRFHRVDLAFAPKLRTLVDSTTVGESRVKFDILELFKPKPSSSTTTTTSTTPSSAWTTTENIATTTDNPDSGNETTTISPSNANDRLAQDTNNTQLVTTFRLDTRRRRQKMIGFGGALSDSTCRNIKSLSPGMAKSLMEDYFGDRGLRYNIARMSIGSSDFSTTPYTNNDRKNDSLRSNLMDIDDVEMNNFHLTDEDYQYKLPIARQAIATSRQEVKFFASLWSPPIWMKNNSHIVHGYLKGDVYGPYYKALAELMLRWLEAYKKNGLDFWAITALNEPVTGIKEFIFHNSLGITRDDYVTFIKLYLGPMMRQRGFQNVKLMMLDDNKGYAPNWVNAMLSDPEASKYISGVAFHWYMNDEYENLNFIPKKYPDKFILATEACNGYLPFQVHALPGNWDRGVAYLYDMIKMIQKNSVGWVDWNMALDLAGGPSWAHNNLDAAIIVNAKRDEYYKSPMFYAMGHFSRFVKPGSTRLDYRIANARFAYPLEAVGFHSEDNYITIVALNANRHPVPFKIIVDRQLVRVVTLRAESFNTIVFKWKKS